MSTVFLFFFPVCFHLCVHFTHISRQLHPPRRPSQQRLAAKKDTWAALRLYFIHPPPRPSLSYQNKEGNKGQRIGFSAQSPAQLGRRGGCGSPGPAQLCPTLAMGAAALAMGRTAGSIGGTQPFQPSCFLPTSSFLLAHWAAKHFRLYGPRVLPLRCVLKQSQNLSWNRV